MFLVLSDLPGTPPGVSKSVSNSKISGLTVAFFESKNVQNTIGIFVKDNLYLEDTARFELAKQISISDFKAVAFKTQNQDTRLVVRIGR